MLHLLWTGCHAEQKFETLTVREPRAQTPFEPGPRSGPPGRPVREAQHSATEVEIGSLELIFDQAARAYEDAVRKRALWKLEHPDFQPPEEGQANLNASQEECRHLDKDVSHTELAVLHAVDSLQPHWDQTKKTLSRHYRDAKQGASRLMEELRYRETWEPSRAQQSTASYESVHALEQLLEAAYRRVGNRKSFPPAPCLLLTCSAFCFTLFMIAVSI